MRTKTKRLPKRSLSIVKTSTDLTRFSAKITPELPRDQKWQNYYKQYQFVIDVEQGSIPTHSTTINHNCMIPTYNGCVKIQNAAFNKNCSPYLIQPRIKA